MQKGIRGLMFHKRLFLYHASFSVPYAMHDNKGGGIDLFNFIVESADLKTGNNGE